MAVKIRLARYGKNRTPHYRVVAIDERKAREGRCLERLGLYTPRGKKSELWLDLGKIEGWKTKGAVLSDTVSRLVLKYQEQKKNQVPAA